MQFFYLLSFAVVASHAAALPQPAELSEKYSNNVDNSLASILEARSYQPASNTREDSDTLVLLKRQANSGGSRSTYVNLALTSLTGTEERAMIDALKSVTPPAEVSKAVLDFSRETMESVTGADTKEAESDDLIANILKDTGAVRQKVDAAIKLLVETVVILLKPFNTLKTLLSKSEKVKILYDQISTMMESVTKFTEEQQKLYDEIIKNLGMNSFNSDPPNPLKLGMN
ncbi:hypothetical protein BASA50_004622 [Batrachochytrium salamandrivorans]|uniref:Uncharacterized protein n=1 Tax=Batrachochytrium salamandrivorans TaxID=1357716 RepID=A0ABQ8FF75_9FUNG|nr:hypothetical protein BASA50_004622 [Batrachochytrium salamandrivorans]